MVEWRVSSVQAGWVAPRAGWQSDTLRSPPGPAASRPKQTCRRLNEFTSIGQHYTGQGVTMFGARTPAQRDTHLGWEVTPRLPTQGPADRYHDNGVSHQDATRCLTHTRDREGKHTISLR
ncbi:hypothetical protein E2C01_069662 [Portunus trituberculatus]|uniref:Uncharacterized protein n=1 Tax=Portunus trituberculatus TaxID=210409 RepID=A0A5B7I1E5_PORTR|nr:hypothetical protein [Portunus trituberculatus]